jgi:hypothetical protein
MPGVCMFALVPPATARVLQSSDIAGVRDATGTVTQGACRDRRLEIQVSTGSGAMRFHATRGEFRLMLPHSLAGAFRPCVQIKGQQVAVRYRADSESGDDGTILVLRVLAAGDSAASDPSSPRASNRHRGAGTVDQSGATTAEGKVTEVTCTGSEMLLKIAVGTSQLTLHARDYSRVTYDQDVGFDAKEFQACTQLKDHTASIIYTPVNNKPYTGEIQSVEVEQ